MRSNMKNATPLALAYLGFITQTPPAFLVTWRLSKLNQSFQDRSLIFFMDSDNCGNPKNRPFKK